MDQQGVSLRAERYQCCSDCKRCGVPHGITACYSDLFQNGVVHRDLKLENILLDQDLNVKVLSATRRLCFHVHIFLPSKEKKVNTFLSVLGERKVLSSY